ncbi:CsgE family curli-type amyloid fiber assembly protein [Tenacibaculum amylolyticum]|uniref:CsgE family curli-type amyloid fiber assembly protein n=1 Tax=Tenacibaculum amylolyticum TaxID=104269 RepID=UPI003893150F
MVRVFTFLFVLLFHLLYGQEDEKLKIEGEILIQRNDELVIVRAQAYNGEQFYVDELNYNLVAVKNASGNFSKNNQTSDFSLQPEEEKKLSELRINLGKDDELRTYLFIKHKGKLLHRDTLFLIPTKKTAIVNEENFLIKGIVVDESITRIGRDYHDWFYKEYLVSGKKYPFIIKIIEKPAIGRNSVIHIEVEGKKIHEFFARPEEEYLKTNVVYAMRKLRNFNQNRKTAFSKL